MNPIGRVFLVLNVALAGTFVAFAGTYLQRDDDWKQKYTDETKVLNQKVTDAEARVVAAQADANEKSNTSAGLIQRNKLLETEKEAAVAANTRLQQRIATMESAWNQVQSHMAKLDTRIGTAVTEMKAAQDLAIAATKEKDDAVAAKNASDKLLAEAQFKIKNQEADIADKIAKINTHEQTIREKEVLLGIVNLRLPGIFEMMTPPVTGIVSHVSQSGKLVTIDLKSGANDLKAGHAFALFSAKDGYKGEAVVNEIDEGKRWAFARLSLDNGKTIQVGDSASTDVSVSKAGN